MADFERRLIDPRLPLFLGIAYRNKPDTLEPRDYEEVLREYRIDSTKTPLPSYEEVVGALWVGKMDGEWKRALALQERLASLTACQGEATMAVRIYGMTPKTVASLCSGKKVDPRGVALVTTSVVGTPIAAYGIHRLIGWAGERTAGVSKAPLWQRFSRDVLQPIPRSPGTPSTPVDPSLPFGERWAQRLKNFGKRWAGRFRTAGRFVTTPSQLAKAPPFMARGVGVFTMVGWADEATQNALGLESGGLASSLSTFLWQTNGFIITFAPRHSRLLRLGGFAGREGLGVVAGRTALAPIAAGAATGLGVLVLADYGAEGFLFDGGPSWLPSLRWQPLEGGTLPIEDEIVDDFLKRRYSRFPYRLNPLGWLEVGARRVDKFLLTHLYYRSNQWSADYLYRYYRHYSDLVRIGSWFNEQVAMTAAAQGLAGEPFDEAGFLKRLVSDPQEQAFLQPIILNLLAHPVPYARGRAHQLFGTDQESLGMPDYSRLLQEAVSYDGSKVYVKDEAAFKKWVDALPVPVVNPPPVSFEDLQKRGFQPTFMPGSSNHPLTFGALYKSAKNLEEAKREFPEIVEVAALLAGGQEPDARKYPPEKADKIVSLGRQFYRTVGAIDALYFSATLQPPQFLDRQGRRPTRLEERVASLAVQLFGFSENRTEWQNRAPVTVMVPGDSAHPERMTAGPVVGWVELTGDREAVREPVHLLTTDSRNIWLMTTPGYLTNLYGEVPFASRRDYMPEKIERKKEEIRSGFRRALSRIEEDVERLYAYAGTNPEIGDKVRGKDEEETLYNIYKQMAGPMGQGERFASVVKGAEEIGLETGVVGQWEERLAGEFEAERSRLGGELKRELGRLERQVRSRARGRSGEQLYEAYKESALDRRLNGEDQIGQLVSSAIGIGLETGDVGRWERRLTEEMIDNIVTTIREEAREARNDPNLGIDPSKPQDEVLFEMYLVKSQDPNEVRFFAHQLMKGETYGLDLKGLGEWAHRWRAIQVVHQIENGVYLANIPEEGRALVAMGDLRIGLVHEGLAGVEITDSPVVQTASSYLQKLRSDWDRFPKGSEERFALSAHLNLLGLSFPE
ncbi:MAG: hypothetical protein HYS22_03275 [Deltaproteobacteria bacterium]|nr:hypothetical protein [Deltaproteobacteria bacterium]